MLILYFIKQNSFYKRCKKGRKLRFLLPLLWLMLFFQTIFVLIYRYLCRVFDKTTYKYQLGIVVIAKNESEYIQEWLAFHKVVGVDKIILFDNESTDNMKELLQPFIDSGFVEYHYWKGIVQQLPAYNEGLRLAKDRFKYLAFIDCDEYLYTNDSNHTLLEQIENIFHNNKLAGGLYVNWKMFGSNGYIHTPEGLCIEAFTKRALPGKPGTRWGKTILRTNCVDRYSHPHYPVYKWGYSGIDPDERFVPEWKNEISQYGKICLNHYFCKSKEQWKKRRALGDVNGPSENRGMEDFYKHDNNDVVDIEICEFVDKVKEIVEKYEKQ